MKRIRKAARLLLMILCLLGIAYGGWQLWLIHVEYAAGEQLYTELSAGYVTAAPEPSPESSEAPAGPPISVDFAALKAECEDMVAWIYCEGTPINYPIVQSGDNSYYLRRMLNGKYNIAGTLFLDYRSAADFTDLNSIVYGHNMKNDTMFGILPEYGTQEFYEEHPVMWLLTETAVYQVELFACCVTPSDSQVYALPQTPETQEELLDYVQSRNMLSTDVEPTAEDRLLTLSTCSYAYDNARYVLLGVLRPCEPQETQP